LVRWFPEFDRVLFRTPVEGHRLILLRTRAGYAVPASALSHGTLLALALMTLGFLRETPPLFAIEEPERGIHPRLLTAIRDALFRLAYPEEYGDDRPGRQIIVTSHSPYFLDLFRENPENVVLAHKESGDVRFERLSDRPDMEEILRDVHLGEAWYSGVLGGA
ncbi:MAG: AAA family ATPase, partial [Steroidobacteraceae bacterium]